jgi:hypothetical protein
MTNERRLIILKDGTKRKLEFPFDICGSKEDFELLIHHIKKNLETNVWERSAYGWIQIPSPTDQMGNGKEPLSWHEESER